MYMEKLLAALKLATSKFYRCRFRVISGALALGMLLCVLHYYTNSHVAFADMSLNYSEASSGLNPNPTRFNISELVSEKVMSRVTEAAGLDGELEWEELAECVSASAIDKGKSSEGYISTYYQIGYDQSKLKSKPAHLPGADDMMKLICNTYKSYFLENYGDNKAILDYEPLVGTDGEPYISMSSLEVKLDQISRYINMRMKESKNYTDEETGANFIALMKDIDNLTKYDIDNIYSFILQTGVSKDKETLVSLETYKNRIDKLSYDKYMAYYVADNNGIKLYDKAMSAIVMIPSVDKLNEYYMSRTKTATDTMASDADSELKEAISYEKIISDTNYLIKQVSAGSSKPEENLKSAAEMIVSLDNEVNRISEELKLLDVSYIKHKTQNYLVFSYSQKSFMQKIDLKRTAIEVFAAVVAFYILLLVLTLRKERKKKKNAKV